MDLYAIIDEYNKNQKIELVDLIEYLIGVLFNTKRKQFDKDLANWFYKDISKKNHIQKPIYLKKEDGEYRFISNGKELFKISKKQYDEYNTNISCLRTSIGPCQYDDNMTYILSNDQYEVGKYGLYEDYSKDKSYTNYRYISIENDKRILYEAYIDKEQGKMTKIYYKKDGEIFAYYTYSINKKHLSRFEYIDIYNNITYFLEDNLKKINKEEYDRIFNDIVDQFFYDIKLLEKKDKYNEIYICKNSKFLIKEKDSSILNGFSVKGKNNLNKENYLVLQHPSKTNLKVLCISDFINADKIKKKYQKIILQQLQNWFLNLDGETLKNEENITDLLKNEIISINTFLAKQIYEIKKKNRAEKNIIGAALGMTLVTSSNTYIINYGDTRTYIYNKKNLIPITTDDTTIWDLYKENKITKNEAFNYQRNAALNKKGAILTNYLGHLEKYKELPNLYKIKNTDYEKLFIFSDGVTDNLIDYKLNKIINKCENNKVLKKIILEAYSRQKAHDDITGCSYIKH